MPAADTNPRLWFVRRLTDREIFVAGVSTKAEALVEVERDAAS